MGGGGDCFTPGLQNGWLRAQTPGVAARAHRDRQRCVRSAVPWEQGVVGLSLENKQQAKHKAAGSTRAVTEFHQCFIYLIFHM